MVSANLDPRSPPACQRAPTLGAKHKENGKADFNRPFPIRKLTVLRCYLNGALVYDGEYSQR